MRGPVAAALGATVTALALATPAAAAPPATASALQVQVAPATGPARSYFVVSAHGHGLTRAGSLKLFNRLGRPITVLLEPVDAVTASTLGSAYAVPGLAIHGATRWTRLPARHVTIAAHASVSIPIAVAVPAGTAPGDYLSGISVEVGGQRSTNRLRSNLAVSSVIRYAIGLEVLLRGARHPRIVLTSAHVDRRPGGLTFLLSATNSGNVILQHVSGSILITQGRRQVAHVPVTAGTFVSGTSIEYPVPASGEVPAEGTSYRVRALMRYGSHVARLDQTIVFGHRQAVIQHQFGGPAPRPLSGGSSGSGVSAGLIAGIAGGIVVIGLAGLRLLGAGDRRGRSPWRRWRRRMRRWIRDHS